MTMYQSGIGKLFVVEIALYQIVVISVVRFYGPIYIHTYISLISCGGNINTEKSILAGQYQVSNGVFTTLICKMYIV